MSLDDDLPEEIRKFVAAERGKALAKVLAGTELYRNLFLYGDDAAEFLAKFVKAYAVDMTGFRFSRYFPDEGESLFTWLRLKLRKPDNRFKPVTVGTLIEAARTKKWPTP